MKFIVNLSILFMALWSPLSARTWTSSEGKPVEAEFVSATDTEVTLKRDKDGKTFTLPLTKLSEDDQAFVKAKKEEPEPVAPIEGEYAQLITGDWKLSNHGNLPYAFYGGKELDGSKKYPLVICLHGKSNNNENGKQTRLAKSFIKSANYGKRPCLILAPLCYQPHGGSGLGWYQEPGDELLDLIDNLIKKLPIVDRKRIYVAGISMGGAGTWHMLKKEPRLFAAGVPIAGYMNEVGMLRFQPIWCFHGVKDHLVDISRARACADQLKRSRVFKYTELPNAKHSIFNEVFSDEKVHEWLFAQRRK